MDDREAFHADRGGRVETRDGRRVVLDYGEPERRHRAVRDRVGIIDQPADVVVVTGEDRVAYVDNVVSNTVPAASGRGCYALLCDPTGRVETDLYALNDGERLLLLLPPGRGGPTVDGWEAFIQDVAFEVATDRFAVVGVHGPAAASLLGTALEGAEPPRERLALVRGRLVDAAATVVRTDAPAGETGFDVVCPADRAVDVLATLLDADPEGVLFGQRVWDALTLEAGTPLFASELVGRIPNVAGARAAVDFEKGCFVGQEVVAKVENVGRPSRRLVGLLPAAQPAAGATVRVGDDAVGEVTRAATSPVLDAPVALASVAFGLEPTAALTVEVDGSAVSAERVELPFVEGGEVSGRLPSYADGAD